MSDLTREQRLAKIREAVAAAIRPTMLLSLDEWVDWIADQVATAVVQPELERLRAEWTNVRQEERNAWKGLVHEQATRAATAEAERDAARADAEQMRAALRRVRDLHHPIDCGIGPSCYVCSDHGDTGWPCATLTALNEQKETEK